jgi:hypothetical protein
LFTPTFASDGAERFAGALTTHELTLLADLMARRLEDGPGTRLTSDPALAALLRPNGSLDTIAKAKGGGEACAVRAVLFDKKPGSNWALGWHQDRTIAVTSRIETDGFGPWSTKAGILHVEPPFEYIESMITLRAHLDDCGEDNAPLLIAPGSHRLGRMPVDQVAAIAERHGTFACLADAGDVWLCATAIVHSSKAARTPTHRRVLQVDYAAASLPNGLEWLGVH